MGTGTSTLCSTCCWICPQWLGPENCRFWYLICAAYFMEAEGWSCRRMKQSIYIETIFFKTFPEFSHPHKKLSWWESSSEHNCSNEKWLWRLLIKNMSFSSKGRVWVMIFGTWTCSSCCIGTGTCSDENKSEVIPLNTKKTYLANPKGH